MIDGTRGGIKVKVVKLKESNKIKVAHVNFQTWRAPKGPSFVSANELKVISKTKECIKVKIQQGSFWMLNAETGVKTMRYLCSLHEF